ncbi:CheR family methyltransferase [Desulfonatronospira thiodismutans]|uniref:CheR family methyltransferase n=1 Tax=Desulfonatronospira thiodismutans TaxID=488939 RepID=UPI0002F4E6CF|nr:CheR family methyltransferase [Desulfonatronospira thiodismutans]
MASRELIFDEFLKRVCPPRELNWRKYRRASRRSVLSRIYQLGLRGFFEYADYLDANPLEAAFLPNLLKVTVSRFFRETELWDHLAADILPAMAAAHPASRPLQVLHIGCCNGEEPYSVSLLWKNEIEPVFPGARISITAMDIDQTCLDRARQGWYPRKTLREVPVELQKKWFEPEDGGWRLDEEIRSMVNFTKLDLLKDHLPGQQDMVFCRYLVFTYFQGKRRREMARKISECINPGGLLILGRKESIGSQEQDLFTAVHQNLKIYKNER